MTQRPSIRLDDERAELIEQLIEAGIADNRSKLLRDSFDLYLHCLAATGQAADRIVAQSDDIEEAQDRLEQLHTALYGPGGIDNDA